MSDYEEQTRPCEICKHYRKDEKGNYACEKWDCEFEGIDELREPIGEKGTE